MTTLRTFGIFLAGTGRPAIKTVQARDSDEALGIYIRDAQARGHLHPPEWFTENFVAQVLLTTETSSS